MTVPTIAEINQAEKTVTNVILSENTLELYKTRYDKKFKQDHTLEEVQKLIDGGVDFERTDKEITKENPMHFGKGSDLK